MDLAANDYRLLINGTPTVCTDETTFTNCGWKIRLKRTLLFRPAILTATSKNGFDSTARKYQLTRTVILVQRKMR